ncbi:unnamed protein product [Caenorhabditis brenneri]
MKVTKKKPSLPLLQNNAVEEEKRIPEETPGKQTFKCSLCSKVVLSLASKRSHALRIHGDLVLFKCGYCDKEFHGPDKQDVQKHMLNNHQDSDGNVDLDRLKDYKKNLKMEIKDLTDMCFPADKVDNQVDSHGSLNIGEEKEDLKKFQCVLCNFALCSRRPVVNHACSHANLVIYECKYCTRKFNSHDDTRIIKRHIRNHHDKSFEENDVTNNKAKLQEEIDKWVKKCFPKL